MASPVIELRHIFKSFDSKPLFSDFHLSIQDKEFVTLLGPSGCGKTTILRMIAGFESPEQGQVFLAGSDITHLPCHQRKVNTVFQNYALFPHMNIYDNVAFGLRMSKVKESEIKKRVLESLAMVKLEAFANRWPHQLSGGQQQRVALARAIINRPLLLLLDEPLSALDRNLRTQMQQELKMLQKDLGITFIFVTHDQEEALSLSDRIIVLSHGQICQDGTPREVYEDPKNLFVANFIGQTNFFDGIVTKQNNTKLHVDIHGQAYEFIVTNQFSSGQKVKVLFRAEDLTMRPAVAGENAQGFTGKILERTYKGMTIDSLVKLDLGMEILSSNFFTAASPETNMKSGDPVHITWIPDSEVVLPHEDQ
jgi:spermidine/putrescine transport system ATP-binding protein